MADKHIKVSVVIVAYVNVDDLVSCLNSILEFNDIGEQLEIIVVDNSPGLSLYNFIVDEFPSVSVIKNENNGFGGGNNVGARRAQGEYILFLNPDTVLVEPIFAGSVKEMEKYRNRDVAMMGFQLIGESGDRRFSFYWIKSGGLFRSFTIKLFKSLGCFLSGSMCLAGADLFIRRKEFFEAGMFDENIFMYYEEPDLTLRLLKIGKKSRFIRRFRIVHLEGGTTGKGSAELKVLERRMESLKYFSYKHFDEQFFKDRVNLELRYARFKFFVSKFFGLGDPIYLRQCISRLRNVIRALSQD